MTLAQMKIGQKRTKTTEITGRSEGLYRFKLFRYGKQWEHGEFDGAAKSKEYSEV